MIVRHCHAATGAERQCQRHAAESVTYARPQCVAACVTSPGLAWSPVRGSRPRHSQSDRDKTESPDCRTYTSAGPETLMFEPR